MIKGLIVFGIALLLVGGMIYLHVSQKEEIKEKVCSPAVYSVQNGEVVEVEPVKCLEVER
jgi:hypothetical protein